MLVRASSNPIFQALLSPTKRNPFTTSPRCHFSSAQPHLGSPKLNTNPRVLRRALSDSNIQDLSLSSHSHIQRFPEMNEEGGIEDGDELVLERAPTIGDVIAAIDGLDINLGRSTSDMGFIMEVEEGEDEEESEVFDPCPSPPMYLATGLGADLAPNFEDREAAEEYYRKMVDKFPTHPLLLRNYAELLKSKGDLGASEEYYFRATLADPEDGEILSQYAKLVWEVHHDQERAGSYFQRAAQVSPHDSHVLAAVASFLWAIEDSESRDLVQNNDYAIGKSNSSSIHHEGGVGADGNNNSSPTEEYYRQLVEQNPSNAMVLRNYAQFLYKSKKDLQGAEEYYSRAILADPEDGEILSQYANLLWELYQDVAKAGSYFERSVQAAPADTHVLAAYASFLWAAGEEEDEDEEDNETILIPSVQTHITPQIPALQGA